MVRSEHGLLTRSHWSHDLMDAFAGVLPEGATLQSVTVFGDVIMGKGDGSFLVLFTETAEVYTFADNSEELGLNLISKLGLLVPRHVYLHAEEMPLLHAV